MLATAPDTSVVVPPLGSLQVNDSRGRSAALYCPRPWTSLLGHSNDDLSEDLAGVERPQRIGDLRQTVMNGGDGRMEVGVLDEGAHPLELGEGPHGRTEDRDLPEEQAL